ncbi:glycerate kinase [Solibacillus sp. A46]|uniref:Glycerate kinase n=1 Tax=Solibacillus faecavium TaxID=2762221 RepID=A0ABR8Y0E4_9BACL|nr:glycerate kinase [Solibacillus faecavium]MBD8037670.1 glycerate kinase [Solibacillus faecavium]
MNIIIAPDSFKGSLSAVEVSNYIEMGIKQAFRDVKTIKLPVGDGGEGTMDTLVAATGGTKKSLSVTGPLGNQVNASYGVLGDGITCVIEMATASGLHLVPNGQLSPLTTTTYGTGELIKHALDEGYKSFVIGLGGSATNDGGAGMLQALGMKLQNQKGEEIKFGGGELNNIHHINLSHFDQRIKECKFLIASDVENPLIGPTGASHVFGPQKGATKEDVIILDENLMHWANMIEATTSITLHEKAGAGAAGGIGGAFQAFFPVEFQRGVDVVLDFIKLNEYLNDAHLVITGEGKVDSQTVYGKTPLGVAQRAKSKNVPTIIIAGSIGKGFESLYEHGVVSVNSIINCPMNLEEAMLHAGELLVSTTEQIVRTFFYNEIKN